MIFLENHKNRVKNEKDVIIKIAHLALKGIRCYYPYFTNVLPTPIAVAVITSHNSRPPLSFPSLRWTVNSQGQSLMQ